MPTFVIRYTNPGSQKMDGKDLNAHLIRSHGRRMTQQRQTVLDIVNSSQEHLDAEAVYEMAKQEDAKISLAGFGRHDFCLVQSGFSSGIGSS